MKLSEIHSSSAPNASNIETTYRVGDVNFDNIDGLGAVPFNQDVKYLGFAMMLTPAEFLSLATHENREKKAEELAKLMREGKAIGTPFFGAVVEDGVLKIVGHEGRARALAISKINGANLRFPVHVFLRGGLRARSLSPDFFSSLREQGIIPEEQSLPKKLKIGEIFWMGKVL